MKANPQEIDLSRFSAFWGLFFAIHVLLGIMAFAAGVYLVWLGGNLSSGLALIGAGAICVFNGSEGLSDLLRSLTRSKVMTAMQQNSRG